MGKLESEIKNLFTSVLDDYLTCKLNALDFRDEYMKLWREYSDSEAEYNLNVKNNDALDRAFTSLDCYCEDASIRNEFDIDEKQLRVEIENVYQDLTSNKSIITSD